jgi:hypothetical protein
MGIKFRCSNGHKIHVKSFLAGKKGRCPECGVKIRVPKASVAGGTPQAVRTPTSSSAVDFGDSNDFPMPASSSFVEAAADALLDPLAVWYVHLPTGQQLGPAGGREVQRWLQQGGVSPGALVWRDGWPEWQPISKVFPQQVSAPKPTATPIATGDVEFGAQSAVPSVANYQRRGRRNVPVAATFLLMGLVVVLFGLLLYVFVLRA